MESSRRHPQAGVRVFAVGTLDRIDLDRQRPLLDVLLFGEARRAMLATIGGESATRMDAIREVTRKFIEGRPNDRIGIIASGHG